MTCFRLKDGTPVSMVLPYRKYLKFKRMIEEGFGTEEAYNAATTYESKDFTKRDRIRKLFVREPSQNHFRIIEGYVCRHNCDPETAIKWAVETGRIKEEELKKCRKDVD